MSLTPWVAYSREQARNQGRGVTPARQQKGQKARLVSQVKERQQCKLHDIWSLDSQEMEIIKIVVTRCDILTHAPNSPAGGAYSAPPVPLAGFRGTTSKGRERKERRMGEKKRGREEVHNLRKRPPSSDGWFRAW